MALTPAQLTTLKTAINNTPAWAAFPNDADGSFALAALLNALVTPNFFVWSTNASGAAIKDAIIWANLTPADVPDGTQAWANRSLQCQGKQFNLQLILPVSSGFGGATLNASNVNLRAGLQDALTSIRSGAAGVSQSAGWTAVQQVLSRRATAAEKVFADTTLADGSTRVLSANLTFEGALQPSDVQDARTNGQ